jgi:LysR family transcriptional regulator, regulator for bpeEF and oprC
MIFQGSDAQARIDQMSKVKHSSENLSAISTFVCVAESTSFTAAAQKLQMSVSGVSKAISRLEDRLRVRLLNRTSRRITLTDEGSAYFERCRQILLDLEDVEAAITDGRSKPRGRIRVQFPRALGKKVAIPTIARFIERFPEVAVDVILDARSLNLEEEGIDVALRYGLPPQASPLIARQLCCVHYIACASPDYVARYGEPTKPEELAGFQCVNYVTPNGGRYREWKFARDGVAKSYAISGALNANDMGALADAAANGAGIAYLPDFIAADYIERRELRVLLRDFIFEGDPIYVVYPRRRYFSPRVRVFLDFLRELFPPMPRWSQTVLHFKNDRMQESNRAPGSPVRCESVVG